MILPLKNIPKHAYKRLKNDLYQCKYFIPTNIFNKTQFLYNAIE